MGKKNVATLIFLLAGIYSFSQSAERTICHSKSGKIHFRSEAPLEIIEASSSRLKGVLDISRNEFAFSIPIISFDGFNSPLQREHFNENYMESPRFPNATFEGKIIEEINFLEDGDHKVRAKGIMTIHGVENELIIPCEISVRDGEISVTSHFYIALKDFRITIPRIVYQKIAEEIYIDVRTILSLP